jgi:hypothetical protein
VAELARTEHLKLRELAARFSGWLHPGRVGQDVKERPESGRDTGYSRTMDQQTRTGEEAPEMLQLGLVVVLEGAEAALARAGVTPSELLDRHRRGDWGDVRDGDRAANQEGMLEAQGIVSAFTLSTGVRVLVITEGDRTRTTVCLGWEYQRELWRGAPIGRFLAYRRRWHPSTPWHGSHRGPSHSPGANESQKADCVGPTA